MRFRCLLSYSLLALVATGCASTVERPAPAPKVEFTGRPFPSIEVEPLTSEERALIAWVENRAAEILAELREHVDINTGTANIKGLDTYRSLLQKELESLGFATRTESSEAVGVVSCEGGSMQFADHLVGELRGAKGPRIFMNGHMDTVFSPEDEFQSLLIDEEAVLRGPGVGDMKGGIVIMLNALRAVREAGKLEGAHITVLFNSDEEIGSLGSRPLIEALARQHDLGLIYEGTKANKVTRARKGLGQVRLKVRGRESHAGGAHEEGVSATLELARKAIAIEELTDYNTAVTTNVGVFTGGEKRNTVPGCADAYIDLRFPTQAAGEELEAQILEIAQRQDVQSERFPELPATEVWSRLHRPVKPASPEVDAMLAELIGLSEQIGETIVGTAFSGGGTDGSISQNVGLPTVDSLGMDTLGAHSSREQSSIASLLARTKLAAVFLSRVLAMSRP